MSLLQTSLSAEAVELNQQLVVLIENQINENDGSITFADYMKLALYTPGLGYYQNALHKFGEKGDFVTAPEMGNLFAEGLARSLVSMSPELTENLLEIGAGTGKLAVAVLKEMSKHQRQPQKYYILEPSASLQSLQYQTIINSVPELIEQVYWLTQLPENFTGVIIANEVIDAIPCERIQKTESGWRLLGVTGAINEDADNNEDTDNNKYADNHFSWQLLDEVNHADLPVVLQQDNYPEGYTCEIRPQAKAWLSGLANTLKQGAILLVDYGYPQAEYYHPQRTEGSLRCFSRHQAHDDVFALTGLQDITAHVDFTEVALAAVSSGMEVIGYTTQAGFLLENGILESLETSENNTGQYQLSQQIQKLVAPGQMGEVIKVIGISKGEHLSIKGFSLQDQLHRL